MKQIKDLTLSPDKFAPRVIDLVEAAKAEARTTAAGAKPAAAPAKKGGGSKKLLIFGGLGVAAAGGAALALKGGGDSGCNTVFSDRSGILVHPVDNDTELLPPAARDAGPWTAQIEWTGTAPLPNVELFANEVVTGNTLTTGGLVSPGKRVAQWQGGAGVRYRIAAFLEESATTSVSYVMSVTGPCQQ